MTEDSTGATPWRKAITVERDERQSKWLVWGIVCALASMLGLQIFSVVGMDGPPQWFLIALAVSAGFSGLVWRMRTATGAAAVIGGGVCLKLMMRMRFDEPWTRTALPELTALLVLTFAATRFGRGRGVVEAGERHGRRASQVVANLGLFGMMAGSIEPGIFVAGLAALAEAAADTFSSEMGQALGGRAFDIITGRRVAPGTDGGVSLVGSVCGFGASAMIASMAVALGAVSGIEGTVVFVAGCSGFLFDSLLGSTAERLGWFGNDLVNFTSTLFAALVAHELTRFLVPPQPFW